jgi:hypothetical protein
MFSRIAALGCAFLTMGFADTLYLRSGTTIQGNYAGGDTRNVKILVGNHVETYPIEDIARLEFGGAPAAQTQAAPAPAPRYTEDRSFANQRPAASTYTVGVDVPSGTNLVVRMIDNVDSERDSLGQTYRASIDEPIVVNGQTVIPRGADVMVKLIADTQSGKFSGRTALTLDIMQVQVNGRMVDVTTSEVTQASGSRTSRTAKTVGGGAVAGAVLGGIFGGGKGAAIGAASGGALGAGAEVMTKGQKVKIPSETRLSFLLQQPLHI